MDDAKKTILARRARLVAAALAGVGAGGCDKAAACLEPPAVTTSPATTAPPSMTTPPEPAVCLKIAAPRDAGAESDATTQNTNDATVGPPAPPPQVCLRK